jgi:hypothetical protein
VRETRHDAGSRPPQPALAFDADRATLRSRGRSTLAGAMIASRPAALDGHGVRLEPLAREHQDGLLAATARCATP